MDEKSSLVYISIEIGMALIFSLIIIFNMLNFIYDASPLDGREGKIRELSGM